MSAAFQQNRNNHCTATPSNRTLRKSRDLWPFRAPLDDSLDWLTGPPCWSKGFIHLSYPSDWMEVPHGDFWQKFDIFCYCKNRQNFKIIVAKSRDLWHHHEGWFGGDPEEVDHSSRDKNNQSQWGKKEHVFYEMFQSLCKPKKQNMVFQLNVCLTSYFYNSSSQCPKLWY